MLLQLCNIFTPFSVFNPNRMTFHFHSWTVEGVTGSKMILRSRGRGENKLTAQGNNINQISSGMGLVTEQKTNFQKALILTKPLL